MLPTASLLAALAIVGLGAGCIANGGVDESDWLGDEEPDAALAWAGEEPSSPGAADVDAVLEPDAADVALCRDLARRRRDCGATGASYDERACAERFACSRRLWRAEIVPAVQSCLRAQPCDSVDADMACLHEAGEELEPSAAELLFSERLAEAEVRCGPLVDVAPAQGDPVYQGLAACLAEPASCELIAGCMGATLQALVAEACGGMVRI